MKVLIASSEDLVRHMAAKSLTPAGFSVVTASDGDQAWLEIDNETGPLIAVLDWQMPGYDGLTLCRTLRSMKFRDYVYVLLLTSRKNKMDELVALESGIDDYLQKPFLADELLARVNIGKRVVQHERKLSGIISEYRAMADLSPFPTVCLDAKGHIRRMNTPFAALAGNPASTNPQSSLFDSNSAANSTTAGSNSAPNSAKDLLGLNIAEVLTIHREDMQHLLRHIQEQRPIEHLRWTPTWHNPAAFPAPAANSIPTAALSPALNPSALNHAGTTTLTPATYLPGNPVHLYGRPVPNHPTITYILTFTTNLDRTIIPSNAAASTTKIPPSTASPEQNDSHSAA